MIVKIYITRIIKHRFVWCIICKQNVPNMGVGKSQEENIKVLMEYGLFDINNEKMNFFWHNYCPRTFEGSKVIYVYSLISFMTHLQARRKIQMQVQR